jgi:hypothetical protein
VIHLLQSRICSIVFRSLIRSKSRYFWFTEVIVLSMGEQDGGPLPCELAVQELVVVLASQLCGEMFCFFHWEHPWMDTREPIKVYFCILWSPHRINGQHKRSVSIAVRDYTESYWKSLSWGRPFQVQNPDLICLPKWTDQAPIATGHNPVWGCPPVCDDRSWRRPQNGLDSAQLGERKQKLWSEQFLSGNQLI